jgi:1,4-alpha-glucan branching enzyme
MIYKRPSPTPGCVRIIFELPTCIWADHIAVVGDFNHWCKTATPMQQNREGVWRATIDLPQGSCTEFRYLVDGAWLTDAHADGYVANAYGSDNSLVVATLDKAHLVVERSCSQVWNGDAMRGYHQPRHAARL